MEHDQAYKDDVDDVSDEQQHPVHIGLSPVTPNHHVWLPHALRHLVQQVLNPVALNHVTPALPRVDIALQINPGERLDLVSTALRLGIICALI